MLLQGGKSGPGAQQIRAGLDRLRQLRLGLGRVTETQVAEPDQVMRVGRLEARRLSSATSAAASAAAGFRGRRLLERKLAGVHQALEDRLGLVGLAELLKAKRLVVGSISACRDRTAACHSATPSRPGWRRACRPVPGLGGLGTVAQPFVREASQPGNLGVARAAASAN